MNQINLSHIQDFLTHSRFDEEEFEVEEAPQHEETDYQQVSAIPCQEKVTKKNFDEFFRCLICFGKVNDPLMCPHCSKFSCGKCFKRWLVEHKKVCPSCRHGLWVNDLIPVRFLNDLNEVSTSKLYDSGPQNNRNFELIFLLGCGQFSRIQCRNGTR